MTPRVHRPLVLFSLILAVLAALLAPRPSFSQAQDGDGCSLDPEDCQILEQYGIEMSAIRSFRIRRFALDAEFDLGERVWLEVEGSGAAQVQGGNTRITLSQMGVAASPEALAVARDIIERRLRGLGVAEVQARVKGDQIIVEMPPNPSPDALLQLITRVGLLEFVDFKGAPDTVQDGACILTDEQQRLGYADGLCLDVSPPLGADGQPGGPPFHTVINGSRLSEVSAQPGNFGNWLIEFSLDSEAAETFSAHTAAHIGERMAIVMDGVVLSAPTIQTRIEGEGQITGNFSREEATALAIQMRYGALPVVLFVDGVELDATAALTPTTAELTIHHFSVRRAHREQFTPDPFRFDKATGYLGATVEVFNVAGLLVGTTGFLSRADDFDLNGQRLMVFSSENSIAGLMEKEDFRRAVAKALPLLLQELGAPWDSLSAQRIAALLEVVAPGGNLAVTRYISPQDYRLYRLEALVTLSLDLSALEIAGLPERVALWLNLKVDLDDYNPE